MWRTSLLACCALSFMAQAVYAKSPAEERKKLLEQLRIKEKPEAAEKPSADPTPPAASAAPAATSSSPKPAPTFVGDVFAVLKTRCAACHGATAPLKMHIVEDAQATYDGLQTFWLKGQPQQSALLVKGSGKAGHGGGSVLNDTEQDLVHRFIAAGALFSTGAAKPAQSRVAEPAPSQPIQAPTDAPPEITEAPAAVPTAPVTLSQSTTDFAAVVQPVLQQHCASCHAEGGMASASAYRFNKDAQKHYAALGTLVVAGEPEASELWLRPQGQAHMTVWEATSQEATTLGTWIREGANFVVPAAVAEAEQKPVVPQQAPAAPQATHGIDKEMAAHGGAFAVLARGGLPLWGAWRLNGRFDLNLERRDFNSNVFKAERNSLVSYHHFVFLTRKTEDDPIAITVEATSLQLWEVSYRLPTKLAWYVKGGKILVPFGGEPLYHHLYGGLVAFDNRVLPVVWAREGLATHAQTLLGPVRLSGDLYVVGGHRLRSENATLNTQTDLAALDDVRVAFGARVSAAFGPLSAWYSIYLCDLDFNRFLNMQAIDVALWRPRGVPLLEHFSLGLGAFRADVSGGGPGVDHYDFATYLQLRFYPLDWIYAQYRQGIYTVDNRRGVYQDTTRLDENDRWAHNVGVSARWQGLSWGAFYFWNLERNNEIKNDFARVTVAYEF